jgi:DNA-binding MarR family transcriptional regulator
MDEREFELVNIIGGQLGANQRDLSRHMALSLGMTNMLIRRLLAKGYIRIKQLNKKKVEYILTPKGFAEKMRKSVRYTLKTIDSIGLVKKNLAALLKNLYTDGARKFYIIGGSDLAGLIEMVVEEQAFQDCGTARTNEVTPALTDGVVLICRENVDIPENFALKTVNVIEELAKDEALLDNGFAFAEGV